ncbi:MAG: hypothetical protein ACRC62_35280 [Microcoleus sp.]
MFQSAINCQLSIDRERGRSHYNYQLSTINRSRAPDARTTNLNSQSIASSRRSHYNYQLSTINSQLIKNECKIVVAIARK